MDLFPGIKSPEEYYKGRSINPEEVENAGKNLKFYARLIKEGKIDTSAAETFDKSVFINTLETYSYLISELYTRMREREISLGEAAFEIPEVSGPIDQRIRWLRGYVSESMERLRNRVRKLESQFRLLQINSSLSEHQALIVKEALDG